MSIAVDAMKGRSSNAIDASSVAPSAHGAAVEEIDPKRKD
jgi:hypothetical protein